MFTGSGSELSEDADDELEASDAPLLELSADDEPDDCWDDELELDGLVGPHPARVSSSMAATTINEVIRLSIFSLFSLGIQTFSYHFKPYFKFFCSDIKCYEFVA